MAARGLAAFIVILEQLVALPPPNQRGPAAVAHKSRLEQQLRRPRGALRVLFEAEEHWRLVAARLLDWPWPTATPWTHTLLAARRATDAEFAQRRRHSRASFQRWVEEQLRTGAGALHRLSKPQEPAASTPIWANWAMVT